MKIFILLAVVLMLGCNVESTGIENPKYYEIDGISLDRPFILPNQPRTVVFNAQNTDTVNVFLVDTWVAMVEKQTIYGTLQGHIDFYTTKLGPLDQQTLTNATWIYYDKRFSITSTGTNFIIKCWHVVRYLNFI